MSKPQFQSLWPWWPSSWIFLRIVHGRDTELKSRLKVIAWNMRYWVSIMTEILPWHNNRRTSRPHGEKSKMPLQYVCNVQSWSPNLKQKQNQVMKTESETELDTQLYKFLFHNFSLPLGFLPWEMQFIFPGEAICDSHTSQSSVQPGFFKCFRNPSNSNMKLQEL